jgi:hypothetical protein
MKNAYSTEVLCEAFCVSRSGFYDWLQQRGNPSARAKQDEQLQDGSVFILVITS